MTLSRRQPNAVQPEGRPAVEFDGAPTVGAGEDEETVTEGMRTREPAL